MSNFHSTRQPHTNSTTGKRGDRGKKQRKTEEIKRGGGKQETTTTEKKGGTTGTAQGRK